ncbi:hypothetical protein [Flavobacterium phycosphaerae]|uniref:hypothetical protein n=1 Tax=Flavobacterium phycosphaerae TaxID=2697515 RepID=UPI00138AEBF0|nr:hypothetical protein [Flavobacterium phycosphaerae]
MPYPPKVFTGVVCLNRNRKLMYIECDIFDGQNLRFPPLQDDIFILEVLVESMPITREGLVANPPLAQSLNWKEIFFMNKGYYKEDWLNEDDFRRNDQIIIITIS